MALETTCKMDVTVLNRSGNNLKIKDKNSTDEVQVDKGKDKVKEFTAKGQDRSKKLEVDITTVNTGAPTDKGSTEGYVVMEFKAKGGDECNISEMTCGEPNSCCIKKGKWGLLVFCTGEYSDDNYGLPTNVEVGIDDPGMDEK